MPSKPQGQPTAASKVACTICGVLFNVRGLGSHQSSCRRRQAQDIRDRAYEKTLRSEKPSGLGHRKKALATQTAHPVELDNGPDGWATADDNGLGSTYLGPNTEPISSGSADPPPIQPQKDDIRTDFHPNSGRASKTDSFENYRQRDATKPPLPRKEPWRPFRSRTDFEFAEIALDAALNKRQCDVLINLLHRCASGDASFTLNNHTDLCEIWEGASSMLSPQFPVY